MEIQTALSFTSLASDVFKSDFSNASKNPLKVYKTPQGKYTLTKTNNLIDYIWSEEDAVRVLALILCGY